FGWRAICASRFWKRPESDSPTRRCALQGPGCAQKSEHTRHIGRQGSLDLKTLAARRMGEGKASGMKRLARQGNGLVPGIADDLAARDLAAAAVLFVAQHRNSDAGEMDANLMRPPCLGQHAYGCKTVEALHDLEKTLRRPARGIVANGHLLAMNRVQA